MTGIGKFTVKASSSMAMFSDETARIYRSGDWEAIAKIKQQSANDLSPLSSQDLEWEKGFINKGDQKRTYYTKSNDSAFVWASTTVENSDVYKHTVQVGTLSKSTGLGNILTWTTNCNVSLPSSIIAIALGTAVIQSGDTKNISSIVASVIAQATQIQVRVVWVDAAILGLFYGIGLGPLLPFFLKRYTLALKIFNWSSSYDWKITSHHFDNGTIPGMTREDKIAIDDIVIPSMPSKDDSPIELPKGFSFGDVNIFCNYTMFLLQNDNSVLGGLGFSLQFENRSIQDGFDYAVMVPRWRDNKQAGHSGYLSASKYYSEVGWSSHPLDFTFLTDNGKAVSASMDKVSGGKNDFYNAFVHIDNEKNSIIFNSAH